MRHPILLEFLDARLPVSSSNPLLEKLRGQKPCIKVLNKKDLADPTVTKAWVAHFEKQQGVRAIPLEAKDFPLFRRPVDGVVAVDRRRGAGLPRECSR